jgi:hypothetical protein
MIQPYLYIEKAKGKGRGVFTREDIMEDTIIEISPVVVLSGEERKLIDQTLLHDYIFVWNKEQSQCCVALGYVSLYNHSYQSNCEYFMDYDEELIFIKAIRDIMAGDEITINYNGDWNNKTTVWFETADKDK